MAPYSVRLAEPIFALFWDISLEIVLKRVHSFPFTVCSPSALIYLPGRCAVLQGAACFVDVLCSHAPPFTSNLPTVGSFKNYVKTLAKSG